ncbi:MAG: hypothetical protein U0990_09670 [Candidatus Nanopelagicales bacterium]|nr:hypothetical protein [Candidatus Nanopelagicales bacterium]
MAGEHGEPWYVCDLNWGQSKINRAIACVNALDGIADPEAQVAKRKAAEPLAEWADGLNDAHDCPCCARRTQWKEGRGWYVLHVPECPLQAYRVALAEKKP